MLVWINGAFGAGTSTVAAQLQARLPDHLVYDPELVGALALRRHYEQPLIVPMTVVRADYQAEMFTALRAGGDDVRAFSLLVSADEVRCRIEAQVLVPGNDELDREV